MSDRKDLTATYQDFARQLQSGALINARYRIVRLLGAGGMGRVYLAKDEQLNIDVALKMIRPELLDDETATDRLKNELLLARRVSHKNVARIHDLGEIDGLKFLTMTYIEGKTLRDLIKETGPLAPARSHAFAVQIAEAMAAAHEEGVIHRDLKPGNILLDAGDRAFVADFGIASSRESADHTASGIVVGTPAYLSPEQLWGERADARTDIYSFGLILYEMLAGHLPFDPGTAHTFKSKPPAELGQQIRKYNPEAPDYLIEIVRKCLHPNKDRRYQNAGSIVQDLSRKHVATDLSVPRHIKYGIVALVLLLLLGYLFRGNLVREESPLPAVKEDIAAAPSILVLPFLNRNSSPELAWAGSGLTELLITDLSRHPNFRIISSDRVFQTMEDLKIPADSYSADVTKKLAEILNADWVVHGTLTQAGTGMRADIKMIESLNPQKVIHYQAAGKRQEDLLSMTVHLAGQIQKQFQASPPESTIETNSIAAIKHYQEGMDLIRKGEFKNAVASFQQSIKSDPNFLKAYLKLSEAFEAMGDFERSSELLDQAMLLEKPNDPRTRDLILAQHALSLGELEKGIGLYQEYSRRYPNDSEILFKMALACEQAGNLKKAADTLEKLVVQDPNHPEAYFHLGKDTILMGEAEKAIHRYLLKALGISTQLSNKHSEADVLNAIGVAYERLGRYDDAVKYYQNSIAIKEEIGNRKGTATSLSNIAKIYIFQGKYDESKEMLAKSLTIFESLKDLKGIADTTNQFGVITEDQGQYNDALERYRKALQIRKELGNDQLTAQSYDNIGHIYYLQGNYENAEVFWEQALTLRKSIGEESGIILSTQNMGFLQIAQGQLDRASKSFVQALQKSRATQYENAIAVSLGNLGIIHQSQGRYASALDSYKEAIGVLEKLRDKKGIAEYTKLAGSVYLDLHDFPRSGEMLNAALKLAKEIQSAEILADLEILLARLYRFQKNTNIAEQHLNEALRIATAQQYRKTLVQAKMEQGWLLLESGKLEESSTVLEGIRKQSVKLNDPWLFLGSHHAISALHLQRKDFAKATEACRPALQMAEKMMVNPYLYRLHSIAGQAFLGLKSKGKAMQHFQNGAKALAEIKKNLPQESAGMLMQEEEAKRIEEGLKTIGG